uniref:Uncharacterized protein n=1 Tax=Nymphaea colorata TaxID=210225 RepID=A0A5K1C894_9MAGN
MYHHHTTCFWDDLGSIKYEGFHQCLKWSFDQSVITIRAEDPVERLMQPMLPRPIDPVDVPSIRTTKERPLEEWMQNMEIGEPSGNA